MKAGYSLSFLASRGVAALLVVAVLGRVHAQEVAPVPPPAAEEKGTFLGVLIAPVKPGATPAQSGVQVAHILPESPAARARLERLDVLLRYDGTQIQNCEHLARLIRDDRPGRSVALTYLRSGKELQTRAVLTLGPVLRIAASQSAQKDAAPLGPGKIVGPKKVPSVAVAVVPLGGGKLKVTIDYDEQSGARKQLSCSGQPKQIEKQIQDLPLTVQNLCRLALEKIVASDTSRNTPDRP